MNARKEIDGGDGPESSRQALLRARNLEVAFHSKGRRAETVRAVRAAGFDLAAHETIAIVGESGSGKSTLAFALTRLLPARPHCSLTGSIRFEGTDLLRCSHRKLRKVRGSRIGYVFQEPSSSLNPVFSLGHQLREAIGLQRVSGNQRGDNARRLLAATGFRDPERSLRAYPFELSGGMQQRAALALALAGEPRLLVADEPTTALDTTIQAQIMNLLRAERERRRMAVLLITHNFGLVKGFADRVLVMFEGQIVEAGPTAQLLENPRHPYTQALIACIPRLDQQRQRLPELDREAVRHVPPVDCDLPARA